MSDPFGVRPASGSPADPFREGAVAARARRGRNLMIAAALIAFVIVIFIVSMIRISGNVHSGA